MSGVAIYTDMDGTLLDHHDYSHDAADPLLAELAERRVPVIPCTSKTRAELLVLRQELGNAHPFIVENGAAVLLPVDYLAAQPADTVARDGFWVKELVRPRAYWLELLERLAGKFPGAYQRFSDMSTQQIAELTGLSLEQARLAADREYGEPLHWLGSGQQREAFVTAMQQLGATVLQGGRFLHVCGDSDKGRALRWLNTRLADRGIEPISIALGDSQNDVAMLEAADYAVVVASPAHPPPKLSPGTNSITTSKPGPEGWDEGIRLILAQL